MATTTSIFNLTQHEATPEQIAAGVVEPSPEIKAKIRQALTFEDLPTRKEIMAASIVLANIASESECKKAMVGCALFMVSHLEHKLFAKGIQPVYAFSKRESVEVTDADGTVRKTTKFRHINFVNAI